MKNFVEGRFFNTIIYLVFAIALPLVALDWHFPFYKLIDASTKVQIGFGGFVALLIVLAFARKKIVAWVKGFDKVTWFRAIFKWLVYVFPSAFALAIVAITYNYGEAFLYVFGWTFVSHMLAGVFMIRAEKAKIENFKRYIRG